ncbi:MULTISPECIES: glutathione transferase GstA [Paraburkholderia]|uniref:glutathione transferase GstA n=1 Tax=Paraburkholderia TaxID=1822464 RepID=UPI0022565938|nr:MULTISPECIES: glutathione transferase GstA [Paraburkholderia]MCX4143690.1 glutathione transferase GstA [Paraburkholderia aspalathi]MCX4156917.1 glutathione transferase GstA [Paraburkholderia aspalathi]MDN7166322.1 glutathione transferase GstA [Paraburkholderia sp. SECH2]MDN7176362.1 glutathione transferase GstA [Paraburkholderia sp. SEWSISQ10-3 4]MDQ6394808.1 glutathione transferase GstA [Paraburkholderia aspalathi]
MKLYYSPGACSLAVHIALREAGLDFDTIKVNLQTHKLANGDDYYAISPRGYVPLVEFDDGSRHTEGAALLQYIADLAPERALLPPAGTPQRFEAVAWLTYISTELHKTFSPWLWHQETAESTKLECREKLATRFNELEGVLTSRDYLTRQYSVADAYAFTVLSWARMLSVDLGPYPHLNAYLARVAARPKVREAMVAEGLVSQTATQAA